MATGRTGPPSSLPPTRPPPPDAGLSVSEAEGITRAPEVTGSGSRRWGPAQHRKVSQQLS